MPKPIQKLTQPISIKLFLMGILLISVLLFCYSANATNVSNYTRVMIPVYSAQGELFIAIRKFEQNNQYYFLVVNPENLNTSIINIRNTFPRNPNKTNVIDHNYYQWQKFKKTPYLKALWVATQYTTLSNSGLTHSLQNINGMFLTVDMCPSINPFEKFFFLRLAQLSQNRSTLSQGFPVAIAISGWWLINHQYTEFQELLNMEKQAKLKITWINHSFSHLYFPDLPLQDNFLLFNQTNIENEILSTEKILIEAGQVPSPFIRFPGLIANEKLLTLIRSYGLIPVGSDAWLAKGQKPTMGSIILVHGNGNEHKGIENIMTYLNNKNILWLPINRLVTN